MKLLPALMQPTDSLVKAIWSLSSAGGLSLVMARALHLLGVQGGELWPVFSPLPYWWPRPKLLTLPWAIGDSRLLPVWLLYLQFSNLLKSHTTSLLGAQSPDIQAHAAQFSGQI